jgi:hypothetical protein
LNIRQCTSADLGKTDRTQRLVTAGSHVIDTAKTICKKDTEQPDNEEQDDENCLDAAL